MIGTNAGLGNDLHPRKDVWNSCRLWSLWDMIQQQIWKFVRAGMRMNDFQSILSVLEPDPK
jgi:hypothetical protein